MDDAVNLTIDGVPVTVPKGTVVVDAAKRIENNIPVFCYHPKMEPVGMCRMCLVEVGMPMRDRATGETIKDEDGNPKVNFGPVLQTGCTVRVADGMIVRTNTNVVSDARDDIIEFLLTSHPLDCPICDKGGECPLQNLTMRYGPGTTRFDFSDKLKQDKHVPLGELINLDRERCIQCARCTRFQAEIADDPVIAFHNRGRHLEIVTLSSPGFDSYWSGNTTDICPVGALTTTDFRFGARPWELTPVASICPHCPVGCNTTMSTRQEAKSDGRTVIKRIMPRQNERVNEIWICDKGRFVHHFASSPHRLTTPLIREGDDLVESTWEEALDLVAGKLQMAKSKVAGLANSRLSNEDLYQFQKLFRQGLDSNNVDLINRQMAGGDVIARVGISSGSNLKEIGIGDAILVVASDLHEEAPLWWLRAKQAAERGADLVVINMRSTRLDKFAAHTIHYEPGNGLKTIHQILNAAKVDAPASQQDRIQIAADSLIEAKNLTIFYGREGLDLSESDILARLLANLLLVRQQNNEDGNYHAGRKNNGLIAVWPHGNTQGAWDMGVHPSFGPGYESISEPGLDAEEILKRAVNGEIETLYLAGADPIGDGLIDSRGGLGFLIVQELFMTDTASQADVVLPAQSWAEREGTFTNGERRVQRFYPALHPVGKSRADWKITSQIGERIGLDKPFYAPGLVFKQIAEEVRQYSELDYRKLAWSEKEWPIIGDQDLYYGGNAYKNLSGLGLQWPSESESGAMDAFEIPEMDDHVPQGFLVVPTAALYRSGTLIDHSIIVNGRLVKPTLVLHAQDAVDRGFAEGDEVSIKANGTEIMVQVAVSSLSTAGAALLKGASRMHGLQVAELAKVENPDE